MTVGKSNMLVARADVDEEDVYRITKVIFENLEELYGMDEAMREVSRQNALTGLTIPLHPGALRYYKEAGLLPPDATIESVLSDTQRAPTVAFAPTGAATNGLERAATTPASADTSPPQQLTALDSSARGDQVVAGAKQFLVYFGTDKMNTSRTGSELTAAISFAEQNPFAEIVVAGHTDRSGDEAYNTYLAQQRAEAVATALREQGIPAERIRVTQYGETAPAVPTADGVQEALNRRVEITVTPSDHAVVQAGRQRVAD
jgi:outer membrane protein OmpA-like peptidoglycan-associated protein